MGQHVGQVAIISRLNVTVFNVIAGFIMGEHVGQIAIISRLNVTVFNVLLPDLGPNTLKSIQIHYNYFDLSVITIT